MKYTPPIGGEPNDPYIDANPAAGIEGSAVPAAAVEGPQRELHNLIDGLGGTPDPEDFTQVFALLLSSFAVASGRADQVFRVAEAVGQSDAVPLAQLEALLSAASTPAGTVIWFGASSAPAGYLIANGSAVSRATYADLYAAIGTTYGAGDGATTFALPDLRGEFVRGWDAGRGVDSGRVFGAAQGGLLETHSHSSGYGGFIINDPADGGTIQTLSPGTRQRLVTSTQSTGGAETRPRNIALLPCIKY